MFKFLRTLSFMRRPRSHSSLSLLNQGGPVYLQRVRIVRPIFTKKRTQTTFFTLVFTLVFYNSLMNGLTEDDKEEKKTPDHQVDEKDEIPDTLPDDALFIPIGFVRQRPTTFYKGTDPEWQGFVQFSRDRTKTQRVRNELAGHVGHYIANLRPFQKMLGTPIAPTKFWIDIDFPDGPPPEYERSGIEIAENYVAWTTRPISTTQYSRLQIILQPFPMLSALWASYRVIWSLQLARIRGFLNLDPMQDGSNSNVLTRLFNVQQSSSASYMKDSHSSATVEGLQAEYDEEELADEEPPRTMEDSMSPEDAQAFPVLDDMKVALKAFERTLAKNWKQPEGVIERGACILSGLVEVAGSRAVCQIDVRAAYHPGESRWIAVGMGVRRLQAKRQAPRGELPRGGT